MHFQNVCRASAELLQEMKVTVRKQYDGVRSSVDSQNTWIKNNKHMHT